MRTQWQRRRESSFRAYIELHRAIVGGSGEAVRVGGRAVPRRFIIVKPCCQLCNRVRVSVSALALGILTRRAVLVEFDSKDYYGRFNDLFDSPLQLQARPPRPKSAERTLPWLAAMTSFMCAICG